MSNFQFVNLPQFPFLTEQPFSPTINNIQKSTTDQEIQTHSNKLAFDLLLNPCFSEMMLHLKPNKQIALILKPKTQYPRLFIRQRKMLLQHNYYNFMNNLSVLILKGEHSFVKGSHKIYVKIVNQKLSLHCGLKMRKPINNLYFQNVIHSAIFYKLPNPHFKVFLEAKNRNNHQYDNKIPLTQDTLKNSHSYAMGIKYDGLIKAKLELGTDISNKQYYLKLKSRTTTNLFMNNSFKVDVDIMGGMMFGKNISSNDYLNPYKSSWIGQTYKHFIASKLITSINYPLLNLAGVYPYHYLFCCAGTNTKNKYNGHAQYGIGFIFQNLKPFFFQISLLNGWAKKEIGVSIQGSFGK